MAKAARASHASPRRDLSDFARRSRKKWHRDAVGLRGRRGSASLNASMHWCRDKWHAWLPQTNVCVWKTIAGCECRLTIMTEN